MNKKIIIIGLLGLFIFVFLAGNFVFPIYFNQGIDFINEKTGINLPTIGQDFRLGPDLQGGALLTYEAIGLENVEEYRRQEMMTSLRNVIRRRIEFAGIIDPLIKIQNDRLVIEMAGIFDVEEAKRKIGEAPFLEFKELRSEEDLNRIRDKISEIETKLGMSIEEVIEKEGGFEKIQKIESWEVILESQYQPTGLTGGYLKRAGNAFENLNHIVSVEFTDEGVPLLEEITKRNLEKPLAIFIDGRLISSPVVRAIIRDGRAQITGNFAREEARELAQNLNAGALPIKINPNPISSEIVGPALGETHLKQSLTAGILGFLLIIVFMILFYKLAGLMASISLVSYIILILFVFNVFEITFTLAGIAGIILSVGMAVDANILIFARVKEELKKDNNFEKAIDYGTKRAWPSIRDGNITTLIIVLILYFSGIPFLGSFALGLGIGIITSLFTSIIITQNLLKLFIKTKMEKSKLLI